MTRRPAIAGSLISCGRSLKAFPRLCHSIAKQLFIQYSPIVNCDVTNQALVLCLILVLYIFFYRNQLGSGLVRQPQILWHLQNLPRHLLYWFFFFICGLVTKSFLFDKMASIKNENLDIENEIEVDFVSVATDSWQ